jgi:hypothetical protein
MNRSKIGLSSGAKAGVVVVVVLVVLGGAYFAPSMLTGSGTHTTSSQSAMSCAGEDGQAIGLLLLFACFSQMQMQTVLNTSGQPDGSVQVSNFAYLVLGTATENGAPHTKVEFSQPGSGSSGIVVAWFNSTGTVDRWDNVAGGRNYTGPGAAILAQSYTVGFGLIPAITNNATLLSMLSKTTANTTRIGPTQLDVTTYHLAAPTSLYKSITVQYATIPGTNLRLVVYLDEKTISGIETTIQITSLTK